jgi:predicted GNAT family N-acyltransferase
VELVEMDAVTETIWGELIAGEPEPWGAVGEGLAWRDRDRNIGLREPDGRLVAAAGVVLAEVEVAPESSFQVVGLGGLIVTRAARGRGLAGMLVDSLLARAGKMGPDRAMLFCRPELVDLYRRFEYVEIADSVWVDQPIGRVEMPLRSMWRALREGVSWPPGRVDVRGLPF